MRPNRGPGFGASPRPYLWPGPRASSAPRAWPALHPHKLVSLLCWALLELVPLTPRFNLFSWGFILRGGRGGRWLSSSPPRPRAPGFLPQGGLGCPLWQEVGPGAPAWWCMRSGCTGFPRLLERPAPLPPRVPAPSPAGRPATAERRHLQSHPGAGCGAGGHRDLTSLQEGKESGVIEGHQEPTPSCSSTCCVTLGNLSGLSGLLFL